MHVAEQVIGTRSARIGLGLLLVTLWAPGLAGCDGAPKPRGPKTAQTDTAPNPSDATSAPDASNETSGDNAGTAKGAALTAEFVEAGLPGSPTSEAPALETTRETVSFGATYPGNQLDGGAVSSESPRLPTLEQLQSEYSTWQPHTAEPVNISAQIFSLCRSPSAAEQAFVTSEHGEYYLRDWLNSTAQTTFTRLTSVADASTSHDRVDVNAATFPTGAAIVKEKLLLTKSGEYQLAALGVMVKREHGYDSATQDWEFGYWEPNVGMLSGPTENAACGPCHAGAPTDFVFLDESWRVAGDWRTR